LEISEQLLIFDIAGTILDKVASDNDILSKLNNLNTLSTNILIKFMVKVQSLTESGNSIVQKKALRAQDIILKKALNIIIDNISNPKNDIFVWKEWPTLFPAYAQQERIVNAKRYEKWNDSTINPQIIVEYLLSHDLGTDVYNTVYEKFNMYKPLVVFKKGVYTHAVPFDVNKLGGTIIVITSYYPCFEYTCFELVKYNKPSIKNNVLNTKLLNGVISVGDRIRFNQSEKTEKLTTYDIIDDVLSSEDISKTIVKINKHCEILQTDVRSASPCNLNEIHYSINFNTTLDEKDVAIPYFWKISKHSHKVKL
jgi:hypothetical protein